MALSREELLELKSQFKDNKPSLSRDELLELKKQFSPQEESSVSKFTKGVVESPAIMAQAIMGIPGAISDATSEFKYNPKDPLHSVSPEQSLVFRSNLRTGLMSGLSDISEGLNPLHNTIFGIPLEILKQKEKEKTPVFYDPSKMSEKEKIASANYPNTAKYSNMAGYIAPSLTPLGWESAAVKSAASLSPAMKLFAKMAGRTAEGEAINAAYNPDDRAEGAGIVAGLAPGSVLLEKGLSKGANAFNAHGIKKIIGGNATSEEIERSLQAAKNIGATSSLGRIADSSILNNIETSLSHVPGAGVSSALNKRGRVVKDTVADVNKSINERAGNSGDEKASKQFIENLNNVKEQLRKETKQNYGEVYKLANQSDSKVSLSPVHKEFDKLENETKTLSSRKRFSEDSDLKDLKKSLYDVNINPATGVKTANELKFQNAIEQKKVINKKLQNLTNKDGSSRDPEKTEILMRLKESLDNSIEDSAKNAKNPEIYEKLKKADKHYAQEYMPFMGSFGKYLRGKKDPDLLSREFLKTNAGNERDNLFQKLDKHLTEESKARLAKETLERGSPKYNGELELKEDKAMRVFQNLPELAKQSLFTPAERAMLESAQKVSVDTGMNIKQMLEPKTGIHSAKILGTAAPIIAAMSPVGFLNTAVGIGISNMIGKSLRSKMLQDAYLKGLKKTPRPPSDIRLSPAVKALIAAQTSQG